MMRFLGRWFALGAVLAVLVLAPSGARAELHIDLTRGKIAPLPIAIPNFAGGTGSVALSYW